MGVFRWTQGWLEVKCQLPVAILIMGKNNPNFVYPKLMLHNQSDANQNIFHITGGISNTQILASVLVESGV